MGEGISILEDIEKVLPPAPTRSDESAAATFLTEMASVPAAVYINGKGDSINGKLDPIYLMSRQERSAHRECSRIYMAT
jgi:hypothetical protein